MICPSAESSYQSWVSPFDLANLKLKLEELNYQMEVPGFWDDMEFAQKTMQDKKRMETKLERFSALEKDVDDVEELIQLAEEENDDSLAEEIQTIYHSYQERSEAMRIETLLSEEYDKNNAILSVHAGAGGTDAQDWTEMLLRMYTRYAEAKGYQVKFLDYQDDNEGGIKSATLLISGENAYGYLKNEKGVHRLVRISPFDSSGRRHTSFASVDVMPELPDTVTVDIDPKDLRIDTYRSSGAGGQHINKTDSAVRITHIPTNIVVSCQNERSQHQNREFAMKVLMARLYELAKQEHKDKIADLAGDYNQITWGSQIRSYVFHPYSLVKDHRTGFETSQVQSVMDGNLDGFINAALDARIKGEF